MTPAHYKTTPPVVPQRNTVRARILAAWPQMHGMTPRQMADHIGGDVSIESVRIVLLWMRDTKQAHGVRHGSMSRWYPGPAPELLPPEPEPDRPIVRGNLVNRMAGYYFCPELRSQPYRAGSQDAYRIASRGFA